MFALERMRIIKSYLADNHQVEVASLSEMLHVSEVTIRRDLEKLEKEGFLSRTHGGAVLAQEPDPDRGYDSPKQVDTSIEERAIAEFALHLISDGDRIMLVGGTLTYELATLFVQRKSLTILTNDAQAAREISAQGSNRAILLGGEISADGKSLYGSLTLGNMRRFHVDKLFFDADGVTESLHISVSSQEKADLIEAAMEISGEKILLCQKQAFAKKDFYHLGEIGIVDRVVTNPLVSDSFKQRIFASGVQLFTSINAFEGRV